MDGGRTQAGISMSKRIYLVFFVPTFLWLNLALEGMWFLAILYAILTTFFTALTFFVVMQYLLIPLFNWCVKNQD
jgi:hypothetical protein